MSRDFVVDVGNSVEWVVRVIDDVVEDVISVIVVEVGGKDKTISSVVV